MKNLFSVVFGSWVKNNQENRQEKHLMQLYKKEHGAIMVMVAVMLPILVGAGAYVVDAGSWYNEQRQLQTVADAASVGGAIAVKQGYTDLGTITAYATHDASLNQFAATGGSSLTIHNPPTSGTHAGNGRAVEAIVKSPSTAYFSPLFLANSPLIGARSVSVVSASSACIATLGNNSGITVNGGGTINMAKCGVYSDGSIVGNGGGTITADTVSAVGTISGASVSGVNGTFTNAPAIADPYANLVAPAPGKCDQNNFSFSGQGNGKGGGSNSMTVSPGTYCNGFKLTSTVSVTMNPGVYIIDRGSFDIGAQATLTGTDVTIILTSSTGSNYADLKIGGSATLNLSAPTSGLWAGILFFEDRNAPLNTGGSAGGSGQVLNGIMYFPSTNLTFAGNSTAGSAACLQIYAYGLTVSGTSSLGSGCTTSPNTNVGVVQLLE